MCFDSIHKFDDYLKNLKDPKHYLAYDDKEQFIGWGFDFIRDLEKWFAIIVHSSHHSNVLGTMILDRMKVANTELNGWVIDDSNDIKLNGENTNHHLHFMLRTILKY